MHNRNTMPRCRNRRFGKRRFGDNVSALLDMDRIQRKHDADRDSIPCRTYVCRLCNGFHLTSKPERTHASA